MARPRGKLLLLLVPTLLMLATGSAAFAQGTSLGGKVRSGSEVVVAAGEQVDGDLYASGGQVRIEGTVNGDLVASGGDVRVTGLVKGDVLVAGGRLDISGQVAGDVRMAGGQLTVSGTVGEDLLLAGGQATISSTAKVGQDLIFGTGQMTLDGAVAGNVLGSTGTYTRHGTIGGTEHVTVGERAKPPTFFDRTLGVIRHLISVMAVAALLLWLLPVSVAGAADTLRRRLPLSIGVGLLALAGFAVVLVVALLVLILGSIVLALLGLTSLVATLVLVVLALVFVVCAVFYVAVTFAAPAAVGLGLGRLVLPGADRGRRWLALFVGVLVIVVLEAIPILGGVVGFVVTVFGLGAVLLALAAGRGRSRPLPQQLTQPSQPSQPPLPPLPPQPPQ